LFNTTASHSTITTMLDISQNITIPDNEIELLAIRAQGNGGQKVNKVSSAIHLRFDIKASFSLTAFYKQRLLALADKRISKAGVIIIKADKYRTQAKNKEDALERLGTIIKAAAVIQKVRRSTRPSKASRQRRLDGKAKRSHTKALRGRVLE
jgi:ribosome-associated protein